MNCYYVDKRSGDCEKSCDPSVYCDKDCDWLCDPCQLKRLGEFAAHEYDTAEAGRVEEVQFSDPTAAAAARSEALDRFELNWVPCCELCPVKGGFLKRLATRPGHYRWGHVECLDGLMYLSNGDAPEVAVLSGATAVAAADVRFLHRFFSVELDSDRNHLLCTVCQRKGGAIFTCQYVGCKNSFHVSCIRRTPGHAVVEVDRGASSTSTAFCSEHSVCGDPSTRLPHFHHNTVRSGETIVTDCTNPSPEDDINLLQSTWRDLTDDWKVKVNSTRMIVVFKDICVAGVADIIAHQCNSSGGNVGGCAKQLFDKYAWADFRIVGGDAPQSGSIVPVQNTTQTGPQFVINMMGQVRPGAPSAGDDHRLQLFMECLEAIVTDFDKGAFPGCKSIAFPYYIGCGIGGGDWTEYKKQLRVSSVNLICFVVCVWWCVCLAGYRYFLLTHVFDCCRTSQTG
jgi:O-acetyl-ADP-ribose deacetylase (regulator of RNase III)